MNVYSADAFQTQTRNTSPAHAHILHFMVFIALKIKCQTSTDGIWSEICDAHLTPLKKTNVKQI